MASLSYVLRDPNSEKESLVYLVIRFDSKQIKYSLGKKLKLHPSYWDKENQCAIIRNSHNQLKTLNIKLTQEEIETIFKPFNLELNRCKEIADKILNNFKYNKIELTKESFSKEFIARYRTKEVLKPKIAFNDYTEQFINEIESGSKKIKVGGAQKKYEYSTVRKYKYFKTQFDAFQRKTLRKYDFLDIDMNFYNKFVDFFHNKNYSTNTIGKHLRVLKTLLKYSYEDGIHSNNIFENKAFEAPFIETDNIYLNDDEINKIRLLDLSEKPTYELARDVFLVGCYTALRYSDYSRISIEHIHTLNNGVKCIIMITKKTQERVIIPIRPELMEILEKYDYNLPKTHEQKINKKIKEIGNEVDIDDDVTIKKVLGGENINETYKKFELIVTHTARRSCATNMYKAGIPSYDIMKITGHKTEQNFLKYLKVGKVENAEILSQHPYFNGNQK